MAKLKALPRSEYEAHWDFVLRRRDSLSKELLKRRIRNEHEGHVLWLDYFEHRRYEVLEPILLRVLRPGMSVLDVGCGDSLVAHVAKGAGLDVRLMGLDISKELLQRNRERWPEHEWVEGDATDPAPGRAFDLVHAGEIIEHLDDRPSALDNWCRRVGQDGWMIVTTPTPTLKVPEGQHVGFVSEGGIRRAMARNGIRLVESHGIGLFVPLYAKIMFRFGDVRLRDTLYRWTLRATYGWPALATQGVYVGKRGD